MSRVLNKKAVREYLGIEELKKIEMPGIMDSLVSLEARRKEKMEEKQAYKKKIAEKYVAQNMTSSEVREELGLADKTSEFEKMLIKKPFKSILKEKTLEGRKVEENKK